MLPLSAQSIRAGYDVTFGIIGEIGKAEISYTHVDESYLGYVHAWTTFVMIITTLATPFIRIEIYHN